MTIPTDDPARVQRAIELGIAARLHAAIRQAEAIADAVNCPYGPRSADEILVEIEGPLEDHVYMLRDIAESQADRAALWWLVVLALGVGGAIGLAISIGGVV